MLKTREREVFFELLKDGRKPDKAIAKKIGTTQPTVTRTRHKLEKDGYIQAYYARPSFTLCDLNVFVITFFRWKDYSQQEPLKNIIKDLRASTKIIAFGRGNGLGGRTAFVLSAHSNLKDYEDFLVGVKAKWGQYIDLFDQFISSSENIFKQFRFDSAVMDSVCAEPSATVNVCGTCGYRHSCQKYRDLKKGRYM